MTIIRSTQNASAATSTNLTIPQAQIAEAMCALYKEKVPSDFALHIHNDLRYVKKDGSLSEKCYWGLVPFFNGAEHLEMVMLQFDLLMHDQVAVNEDGTFKEFWTPQDALHTYARETADTSIKIDEWLNKIANKFQGDGYKMVLLSYIAKNLKGGIYRKMLWGVDPVSK